MLPVVTFGWGFDQVERLHRPLGGADLRQELTDRVAGDIGKALAQASAWEQRRRVAGGGARQPGRRIARRGRRTWEGRAATVARAQHRCWVDVLGVRSEALAEVAAAPARRGGSGCRRGAARGRRDPGGRRRSPAGTCRPRASRSMDNPAGQQAKDVLRLVCDARKVHGWSSGPSSSASRTASLLAADTFTAELTPGIRRSRGGAHERAVWRPRAVSCARRSRWRGRHWRRCAHAADAEDPGAGHDPDATAGPRPGGRR